MRTEARRRTGLAAVALGLGLLVASCGGNRADPIKIAFIDDCHSVLASPKTEVGAELPFRRRGSRLRGTRPSSGVTEATVAGKPVQLLLLCESYGDFTTLLGALRRAVENDGADIVVLSDNQGEGPVVKDYARKHPKITFSTTSGEESTTLDNPAPNLFRFAGDSAQASAGLGAYAYRTLGWRRAVTVGEDDPAGWAQVAGFVAEFCSLGGHIVKGLQASLDGHDFGQVVAKLPSRGVDGVVLPSDLQPAGSFRAALARRYPRLGDRLLVNVDPYVVDSGLDGMRGLVGVSNWPLAPTAESSRFPSEKADVYAYDAMEPVLEALKRVRGDLSGGERGFQHALGRLHLQAPNGPTTLDGRHQAIAPTYLGRVGKDAKGKLVVRQIGVVPKVEQTFGGYFSPTTHLLSRNQPTCHRRKPPAWVSSIPVTR